MVFGGTSAGFFAVDRGLPFAVAAVLAVLMTALVGLVVERVALRPMVGKPVFTVAIITIGVDIVLRQLQNRYIGAAARPIGDPIGLKTFSVGALPVQLRYLVMLATMVVLVAGLVAFFRYARAGLAMRAASFDQEVAMAQGIGVGATFALAWALAGALAAVAGILVSTGSGVDQQTWTIALKALPAIIVGGLDSIGGAVAGGLIIGIVESLFSSYQGQYLPWLGGNFGAVSPYVVMLAVLLVRPYGLFGTAEVERV